VYSGTLIVQGQGIAKVKAIGMDTELGKIGKSLQTLETEETLLQKETRDWSTDSLWQAFCSAFWS